MNMSQMRVLGRFGGAYIAAAGLRRRTHRIGVPLASPYPLHFPLASFRRRCQSTGSAACIARSWSE
jgi:hypothetical protein